MDFSATYLLGEGFLRGALRAKEVGDAIGGNDIALTSGEWTPSTPLRFRQYEGRNALDCVGTQRANIKLVSEKFVSTLRAAGVSGWATYSVALEVSGGAEVKGYSGFVVRGRCGPVDNARSVRVERAIVGHPQGRALIWRGLYFPEDSWDGTDVFRPAGTGYIFTTERLRTALRKAHVTNFCFNPLAEVERSALF